MGPKPARVCSVESWVPAPRSPWICPRPASRLGPQQGPPPQPAPAPTPQVAFPDQAGPLRAKRAQQTAPTPLLGSVQPLQVARAGGRNGAPLGKTRKVSGSQARVVCFRTLHPITTSSTTSSSSSPYGSVWLVLRSTPTAWGAPSCPRVPDAAPLPTGLPSGGGPSVLCPRRRGIVAGRTGTARPARSALLAAG